MYTKWTTNMLLLMRHSLRNTQDIILMSADVTSPVDLPVCLKETYYKILDTILELSAELETRGVE